MDLKLVTVSSLREKNFLGAQFVFRPHSLAKAVGYFKDFFEAKTLYAVKTNPDSLIIESLFKKGIKAFDVASLEEIKLVSELCKGAELYFMNPVKSRFAIREAYHKYGVRHFSLDDQVELKKIMEETNNAEDLNLHVRIAIPNNFAEISLSEKFGVNLQEAPNLIKEVKKYAKKIGICFHVGSQCMHPDSYRIAIRIAGDVMKQAEVKIDYFNVGGGFPSIYPGLNPPEMKTYFNAIHEEFKNIENYKNIELLAEPGRALVAESMSLIVRVELRKENSLYINDGTYGSLFDAGVPGFIFPMKLISDDKIYTTDLMPYSFYGPTCDSLDYMKGPFYLPDDISEGDLIEIGQMGAYGYTMATSFNGFKPEDEIIFVSDEPLMSVYEERKMVNEKLEIIAA